MSAATQEKPSVLAAPPDTAVFMSRRDSLVLVFTRDRPERDQHGERVDMLPGTRVAFVDNVLRVPMNGTMTGTRGEELEGREVMARLEGGEYEGQRYRAHKMLGNREEGFWRHHEAPPQPTDRENNALADLVLHRDVEGIEAFLQAEREGWDRPALVNVAEKQLKAVKAVLKEERAPQRVADGGKDGPVVAAN